MLIKFSEKWMHLYKKCKAATAPEDFVIVKE